MGFPENLLDSDERVVMHLHPHWKVLIMPVLWLILIVAAAGFGVSLIGNSTAQLIIVGIAVLLLLYTTVRPLVSWLTTQFVFTTHRVLTRTGILHRTGRDIPLARINDVSFSNTLIERLLGCGTLMVESASERGQIILHDIPHAETVQARLYRLVEEDAERRAAMHHPPGNQVNPMYPGMPPGGGMPPGMPMPPGTPPGQAGPLTPPPYPYS